MTKEELKERAIGFLIWKGMSNNEAERYFNAIWDQHAGQSLRIPTIMRRLGLDRAQLPI